MPVPEDIPMQVMKMFMTMVEITWLMPPLATFENMDGMYTKILCGRCCGTHINYGWYSGTSFLTGHGISNTIGNDNYSGLNDCG